MSVALELLYHVPGSQVWPGSRGAQRGNVHLHVTDDVTLGRRTRHAGECLCAKRRASYPRALDPGELDSTLRCESCFAIAAKHELPLPPECRAREPEAVSPLKEKASSGV